MLNIFYIYIFKYSRVGLYTAFDYKNGYHWSLLTAPANSVIKTTCNEKRLPALILNKLHRPYEKKTGIGLEKYL